MKKETKKRLVTAVVSVGALAGTTKLTVEQIVRAWESPEYRNSLSLEQKQALPSNPAGDLLFQVPGSSEKPLLIADTQYAGCNTQYAGCNTQYAGCDTQYAGCNTQYAGCSTQFANCIG
jgi:mersacidin/lichenicidin family type 2 lantibiotic